MSDEKFQVPDIKLAAVTPPAEDGLWEIVLLAPGELAAVRIANIHLLPLLGTQSTDPAVVRGLIEANEERVEAYIRGAVIAKWSMALGVFPVWKADAPKPK